MAKSKPVTAVQPAILRWARESLGLTFEDVASKLKRSVAEIQAWEEGKSYPSYPQLEKLAYNVYKRPIAVFFLPQPPQEKLHKKEFRTLPATDLAELSADIRLHIRKAHAYQLSLQETFEDSNPATQKIWQELSLDMRKSLTAQAKQIRKFLSISLELQASWKTPETGFKQWRRAIEDSGIFVFKNSFKQKDISGFCLYHNEFPVIYLNNSTTITRQIFSLLHELAHLLLRMNGISKEEAGYMERLPAKEKKVEQFANAMAAEILIPDWNFSDQIKGLSQNMESLPETVFADLAKDYCVSREVILRKLLNRQRYSRYRNSGVGG